MSARMNTPDVMTIDELAVRLRLSRSALEQLAQNGTVPGRTVDGQWRFHRATVDAWLAASGHTIPATVSDTVVAAAGSGRVESFDVHEHEQLVRPWDVRLNQLSRGRFHAELRYVSTPRMLIYEERWSKAVDVRGASPEGWITLGTNLDWQGSEVTWCGQALDSRRWACRTPAGEVDFRIPERSHHVVLLTKPELLSTCLRRDSVDRFAGRTNLRLSAIDGKRLVLVLRRMIQEHIDHPELLRGAHEVRCLEARVLDVLGRAVDEPGSGDDPAPSSLRTVSLRRAIEQIEESDGPLTTLQLATAAGVSRRTLEYAFREGVGVTPTRYLRLHCLNRARRALSAADPRASTVGRIARECGFNHLGRFAVEYRMLFEESPSETLASACRPPTRRLADVVRAPRPRLCR